MIQYKNIFINETDNQSFIDFCLKAYKTGAYITVFYEEGFMSYEGIFNESKSSRTFRIGKSTGTKPILLEINTNYSSGGCSLFACEKAIKRWKFSSGEEVEVNETLDSSLYRLIQQAYEEDEEDEEGCWRVNQEKLKEKIQNALNAFD